MEDKVLDLLVTLKNSSEDLSILKDLDFCKSLCEFSKNENKFIKVYRNFENHEVRTQIFKKLFIFLPITQNIIKLILEKKIFPMKIFYEEIEDDNISNYFSKNINFYKKLDNLNINPQELIENIKEKEKELSLLKQINNNLQDKSSKINQLKKKNKDLKLEIFNEKISSERNFKIDKLYEKVERFNKKLKILEGTYE